MSDNIPELADPAPDAAPEGERVMQIALVDDDRNILTSVSIALQAEGFRTRVYNDSESALKALASERFRPSSVVLLRDTSTISWVAFEVSVPL